MKTSNIEMQPNPLDPIDELPKPPLLSADMTSGEAANVFMAQMSYAHRQLIRRDEEEAAAKKLAQEKAK
jgi:hypothetical protein